MKTAIYLRKSRAEEGESTAETLARHKSTLLEFAKAQGLEVVHIYEEVVSGDSLYARPEMLKLLEAVEQGAYDAVLCMDIDRLGRGNMQEQGRILETFKQADTKIITPRKVYDLNNELDETYSEFEAFMARQELKIIKKRMHRGRIKSIQQGCYVANAPFGYENATVNKQATLKAKESEAEIVRLIFDLYVNQGKGCQTIAHMLNNMGVKPHRASKFGRTSVAKIIKNPVYIGKIAYNRTKHERKGENHKVYYNDPSDWIVTDGRHEAIIDEETFYKAQEIFKGRYHPPSNKGIIENPLAGLVICGNCGAVMQRRPYMGNIRPDSLICPNKGCITSTYLYRVENLILKQLETIYDNYMLPRKRKLKTGDTDIYKNAVQELHRQLKTIETQKSSLYDLLEQGVYSVDLFTERMNELARRRDGILLQIKETEELMAKKNTIERSIHSIPQIIKKYPNMEPGEKNTALKSVINKIIYNRKKGFSPTLEIRLKA